MLEYGKGSNNTRKLANVLKEKVVPKHMMLIFGNCICSVTKGSYEISYKMKWLGFFTKILRESVNESKAPG